MGLLPCLSCGDESSRKVSALSAEETKQLCLDLEPTLRELEAAAGEVACALAALQGPSCSAHRRQCGLTRPADLEHEDADRAVGPLLPPFMCSDTPDPGFAARCTATVRQLEDCYADVARNTRRYADLLTCKTKIDALPPLQPARACKGVTDDCGAVLGIAATPPLDEM